MLIFYDHPVTHLKLGRNVHLNATPTPGSKTGFHLFRFDDLEALHPGNPPLRVFQFLFSNESVSQDLSFQGVK
jgi:hypothetical protein